MGFFSWPGELRSIAKPRHIMSPHILQICSKTWLARRDTNDVMASQPTWERNVTLSEV